MEKIKPEVSLSNRSLKELLEDTLMKKACFRFTAKGFSMSPFIKDSDVVTVSPLNNSLIGFGRVVAFIDPLTNKLLVHRVIGKKEGHFLIKADNSFDVDGFIPIKDILGFISKVERGNKKRIIGLGLEKALIAFLSRVNALLVIIWIWRMAPNFIRRILLWQRA